MLLGAVIGIVLGGSPGWAAPVAVDGRLEHDYGAALSVQTTQTTYDASSAGPDFASASELDQAFGFVSDGALHLFIAGNLLIGANPIEPGTFTDHAHVFLDTRDGGQNVLRSDNASVGFSPFETVNALAGLAFDAGFAPDYWLDLVASGGPDFGQPFFINAYEAELLAGGGGPGLSLGYTTAGGSSVLSGGTNPHGIAVALDDANTAGVDAGCGAASGAGVTTGIEWSIPLAAIGDPSGCIGLTVFTSDRNARLYNQVLGPLPPGTCMLGPAAGVSFAAIAGAQFFTVCGAAAGVGPGPGSLAVTPPEPNPMSSEARFTITLDRERSLEVAIHDVTGRRVGTLFRGTLGAGPHAFAWRGRDEAGSPVPAGVFFVRVRADGTMLERRIVRLIGR
jgi:hypothetical protein